MINKMINWKAGDRYKLMGTSKFNNLTKWSIKHRQILKNTADFYEIVELHLCQPNSTRILQIETNIYRRAFPYLWTPQHFPWLGTSDTPT